MKCLVKDDGAKVMTKPETLTGFINFCKKNYDTQFPRFAKLKVNGKDESPLYTFLKSQKEGKIKWNFTKFLISRDGEVLERFEPGVEPAELEDAVKTALEQAVENARN